MVAIVDYDAGNVRSVTAALRRLEEDFTLTSDPQVIASAPKVILPGVGAADKAMESLRRKGLVDVIRSRRKPVLGICVGMQIMCADSQEGPCSCMGIFDTSVRGFVPGTDAKVPHMGWNAISNIGSKLLKGIDEGSYVYFVHSFYPGLCTDTIATCRHGSTLFSAALRYENFYGTQFHPEKSGEVGEMILRNFLLL